MPYACFQGRSSCAWIWSEQLIAEFAPSGVGLFDGLYLILLLALQRKQNATPCTRGGERIESQPLPMCNCCRPLVMRLPCDKILFHTWPSAHADLPPEVHPSQPNAVQKDSMAGVRCRPGPLVMRKIKSLMSYRYASTSKCCRRCATVHGSSVGAAETKMSTEICTLSRLCPGVTVQSSGRGPSGHPPALMGEQMSSAKHHVDAGSS